MKLAQIFYEGSKAYNGRYHDGKAHIEVKSGAQGKGKLLYHQAYDAERTYRIDGSDNWYDIGVKVAHEWMVENGYKAS